MKLHCAVLAFYLLSMLSDAAIRKRSVAGFLRSKRSYNLQGHPIHGYPSAFAGSGLRHAKCEFAGEVFAKCGVECSCLSALNAGRCRMECSRHSRCTCRDGFVRDSFGTCIPLNACRSCGRYEVLQQCGRVTTCQMFVNQGIDVYSCSFTSLPLCYCKQGYARSLPHGLCVQQDICKELVKGPGGFYRAQS